MIWSELRIKSVCMVMLIKHLLSCCFWKIIIHSGVMWCDITKVDHFPGKALCIMFYSSDRTVTHQQLHLFQCFNEWNIIHQSSFSFFSDCDSPVICSVMSATDQLWFMVKFHKEEERHVNRLVGWIWQENLFESHFYITILKGAVSILLGYQWSSASSTSKSSLNPIF